MINYAGTQPTSTIGNTALLAMGALAIMGEHQVQYPTPVEAYKVEQVDSTFSSYKEGLRVATQGEFFASEMVSIYASFAERQRPLGADFEAAIFDDLEGLYEA